MSRQACHLVAVLAEALGHVFGGLALHFVQDLLKMVVITIQVRLQSSLHCCHVSGRSTAFAAAPSKPSDELQAASAPARGICFAQCHRSGVDKFHVSFDLLPSVAQIMADAADGALAAVLRHCRVAALLPPLALPLIADRSVKLRHCCAAHLLQVQITFERLEVLLQRAVRRTMEQGCFHIDSCL